MGRAFKSGVAVVAALGFAVEAQAQLAANNQLMSTTMVETLSASDISEMLAKYGIATQMIPYEGEDAATLAASTEGGGRFLVSLFGCEDPATGENCQGAATYTAFSNAGLAYEDINTFNTDAQVAKAVNVAAQNIIVFGIQRFFKGGVSVDNIEFEMILFLNDMQDFLEDRQTAATSVALDGSAASRGKADNITAPATAASLQRGTAGVVSTNGAIGAAIMNTGQASFAVEVD
jgi:hypothetical protein